MTVIHLPTIVPNRNDIFLPALLLRYFIRKDVTKLAVYITRGTMATLKTFVFSVSHQYVDYVLTYLL